MAPASGGRPGNTPQGRGKSRPVLSPGPLGAAVSRRGVRVVGEGWVENGVSRGLPPQMEGAARCAQPSARLLFPPHGRWAVIN